MIIRNYCRTSYYISQVFHFTKYSNSILKFIIKIILKKCSGQKDKQNILIQF